MHPCAHGIDDAGVAVDAGVDLGGVVGVPVREVGGGVGHPGAPLAVGGTEGAVGEAIREAVRLLPHVKVEGGVARRV